MWMRKITGFSLVVLCVFVANAWGEQFNLIDARMTDPDILRYCEPMGNGEIGKECEMFIESVVMSHHEAAIIVGMKRNIMVYRDLPLAFCIPSDTTIGKLASVLVGYVNEKYLDKDKRPPFRNTQYAAYTAVVAFSEKYPCHFGGVGEDK